MNRIWNVFSSFDRTSTGKKKVYSWQISQHSWICVTLFFSSSLDRLFFYSMSIRCNSLTEMATTKPQFYLFLRLVDFVIQLLQSVFLFLSQHVNKSLVTRTHNAHFPFLSFYHSFVPFAYREDKKHSSEPISPLLNRSGCPFKKKKSLSGVNMC